MRGKTMRRFAAYILFVQMIFSAVIPCRAAQIGSGAAGDGAKATAASDIDFPFITSVTISPGTVVVSKDTKCSFTAYVAGVNNYSREVAWSVSGQTSQSTFIDVNGVLNVAADETASSMVVKAVSKQDSNYSASALVSVRETTYYIHVKASPENGGAVYGSGEVKEGGYAVISAAPNNGFSFEGWTLNENRVSQNAQYTVDNIRGDATYVAEFKPVTCRINVNVNDTNAGTATESRSVNYGEGMVLEASAKEGYQFDGWTENGVTVSKDSRMQLDHITDSRTFTAVFSKKNEQPKTYTITATASSENGTITPAGKSSVKEGEGILYTITPKSGYAVRAVYVDGKEVGWMTSFNFTDVRENHTISVDFAETSAKDKNGTANAQKTDPSESAGTKEDSTDKKGTTDRDSGSDKNNKENTDGGETAGNAVQEESGVQAQESGLTGTLKHLQIPVQEAERLIKGNNDAVLMAGALETGDLQMTIYNDFADTKQETSDNGFYKNTSVPNFEVVLDYLLNGEEKLEMLQGEAPIVIDLQIEDANGKEPPQVQKGFAENKLPGMNIGQYFEVSLTASKKGEIQTVSEMLTALQMIINVPEHLKAENRKYYVLRLHTKEDGSQEFAQLADEDDNPDTITFSTDKFSPYAIAYMEWNAGDGAAADEAGAAAKSRGARNAAGIVIVLLAVAATVTGILYIAGKRKG